MAQWMAETSSYSMKIFGFDEEDKQEEVVFSDDDDDDTEDDLW